MKKTHFFTGLLLVLLFQQCKTQKSDPLQDYFKAGTIPSAIMGTVDDKGTVSLRAFGPSVWGGKDTVSADHIFRIYSMTKAVASVAAMQLVEQGKIGLDVSLYSILPEMTDIPLLDENGTLTQSKDTITLRQLLTHTSGFGYTFTSSRLAAFHPEKWPYSDYPRLFKPGTGWNYGTSTDWVGRVIEKISGQDLESYLREHVTGPLKMDHTWFNVPEALQEKIVSWGSRDSTGTIIEDPRLPEAPVTKFSAGGGLYSSPSDYLKFLHCMLNFGESNGVRILKRETVEMMLQDNLPETVHLRWEKSNEPDSLVGGFQDNEDRFGLAWAIEANPAEHVRPKGAVYWAGAANSYYTLDVKNKVAIAYFTQFFPFNDRESYSFYKLYEREVYKAK